MEWVETIRHAHLDDPCSGRCDGVTRQEKRIKTSQKEGISCINIHLGQMFYVYIHILRRDIIIQIIFQSQMFAEWLGTRMKPIETLSISSQRLNIPHELNPLSHAVQHHPDAPVTILHFWMVAYLVLLMF